MDRFWNKVKKGAPDECWEWQASRGSKGYGQSWWKPAKRAIGAHQVAYLLTYGEIPEGLQVAHTCHNKLCCNPAHLEPQTSADNNWANYKDKRTKAAKLTDWQIQFIWWLRLNRVRPKDIAKAAEVSLSNVEDVIYRRRRHLERLGL
jgi:hypothetical protein